MLIKIFGLLAVFLGFLILKYFPDVSDFQKSQMTLFGVLIGVALSIAGIVMLIFG